MEPVALTTANFMSNIQGIPRTPLRFIWFATRPYRWLFVAALVLSCVTSVLHLLSPFLFKFVIDALETGDVSRVPLYILVYPVLFVVVLIVYRITAVCMSFVGIGGRQYISENLSEYVLGHSQTYFSDRFAGSLSSKLSTTASAFNQFIEYVVWNYADALISILFTSAVLWTIYPPSAYTLIVLVLALFVLNVVLSPRNQALSTKSIDLQAKYTGTLVDVISNASIVRQFSRLTFELSTLSTTLRQASRAQYHASFYSIIMILINGLMISVGYAVILLLVVQQYTAEAISTGDIILVLGLLVQLAYMLLFLGNSFQSGSQHFGELKSGLAELLQPYDIVDAPNATALQAISSPPITFTNITFTYKDGSNVFTDFNLTINAGERIGLVGHSGAGKSSLVGLLMRQYDLTSGVISIAGQDIQGVTQDSLRERIAIVPQEPALFHRSIKENIAYGNPSATDEDIIAVAKKAQAHDFIMSLSDGYNTLVGERGVKLSGGQKQRIAIARAMLKDAPILILDEATSALDSESEQAIQTALHFLMADKTVIAIAHRLSTLREMDRIVVLNAGKIVEDGTHETLSRYGGVYQRLWDHQVGGFVAD